MCSSFFAFVAYSSFQISLNNAGVVMTVLDVQTLALANPETVVQRPLNLIRPIDVARILDPAADEPLMRVLVTRTARGAGSTAIGISSWHPIGRPTHISYATSSVFDSHFHICCEGDGNTMLRFVRTLSQLYQGLPPLDAPPVWRHQSLPEADPSWELEFPSARR
jgi:hypothetical protein